MEFNELAQKLGRSTRTPYTHVHRHNDAVKRIGLCALCRRAEGEFENKQVSTLKLDISPAKLRACIIGCVAGY